MSAADIYHEDEDHNDEDVDDYHEDVDDDVKMWQSLIAQNYSILALRG